MSAAGKTRMHIRAYRDALRALTDHGEQAYGELAAISSDPRLTEEARQVALKETLAAAERPLRGLIAKAREERREGLEWVTGHLRAGDPDPTAHARVRSLLERGVAPSSVLDHASKLGDRGTLHALRHELDYYVGDNDSRLHDAEDLGALLRATEFALADTLDRDEQAPVRALRELVENEDAIESAAVLAMRLCSGQRGGQDRLAHAYALNGPSGDEGSSRWKLGDNGVDAGAQGSDA